MKAHTFRLVALLLAALTFCIPFVIATLAGLPPLAALLVGAIAIYALGIPWIVMCLVPTAIVRSSQINIQAPRDRVFAAIADPRHAPRLTPAVASVDELVGEPGAKGSRWKTRFSNGTRLFSEVVEVDAPARIVVRSRSAPRWPRRPW